MPIEHEKAIPDNIYKHMKFVTPTDTKTHKMLRQNRYQARHEVYIASIKTSTIN